MTREQTLRGRGAPTPAAFRMRHVETKADRVLVCVGDSITRGEVSADWVSPLTAALNPRALDVVNGGVNGELAWNVLQRLNEIVACRPTDVTLLIGTNDVQAVHSPENERAFRRRQRLPQVPDIDWFTASADHILSRLRQRTDARIAVIEIPPLGEDLQSDLNHRVRLYNDRLHTVARGRDATWIPIVEDLAALAPKDSPLRGYRSGVRPIFAAAARRNILRSSWNEISHRNGYHYLTDGIHLNDTAAAQIASKVTGFLRSA